MNNSEIAMAAQSCHVVASPLGLYSNYNHYSHYQYFSPYQPHGSVTPPE